MLDVKMPDMDGTELCQKLKELNPDLRFVFLTGHADRNFLQSAMGLGAYLVVDKPFDTKLLLLSVQSSVEKAQYEKRIKDVMMLFIQNYTSLDFATFSALPFAKKDKIITAAIGVAQLQAMKIPRDKKS